MIKNSIQNWDGHSAAEKEEYIKRKLGEIENSLGAVPEISTDVVADADSDVKAASPKAVKVYVDNAVNMPMESVQPDGGFLPNVLYALGKLSGDTTFALATPTDNTIVNHYYWTFETGTTAPTITWPAGITWAGGSAPSISENKHYEISVLNSVGLFTSV